MGAEIGRRKALAFTIGAAAAFALPAEAQPKDERKDDAFLIFFDYGRSDLTEPGRKLAEALADAIPEHARVTITGHCDSAEPNPEKLGFARANAVLTQFLRNPRMAKVRFNVLNDGAARPLVQTPPNTREPQNRRVEIVLLRG